MSIDYTDWRSEDQHALEVVRRLVLDRIQYPDTMHALSPPLSFKKRAALEKAYNRPLAYHKVENPAVAFRYQRALHFSQPSEEVLRVLSEAAPDHIVSRLDVSLDLVTASMKDAKRVHQYIARHTFQRWHRSRGVFEIGLPHKATTAFNHGQARRQQLVYSDKESKLAGQPCAHVELRFIGSGQCRKLGIIQASDLIHADLGAIIQRYVTLYRVLDREALHRAVESRLARLADRERQRIVREDAQRQNREGLDAAVIVLPGRNLLRARMRFQLAEQIFGPDYDVVPVPWSLARLQSLLDFTEREPAVRRQIAPMETGWLLPERERSPLINELTYKAIDHKQQSPIRRHTLGRFNDSQIRRFEPVWLPNVLKRCKNRFL